MADYYLYTPGPTSVPEKVRKRMAEQVIYHRGDEFKKLFTRINKNLQYIFQTSQPVLTLVSSGTGGMEATFVNLFSPDDTIISVNNGKFSARWVEMPRALGLKVIDLRLDWGEAPTAAQVLRLLRKHPQAKAVYLVHCETSTGTVTDVRSLAKVIRNNSSALVCVDGVSSIGALEFRFDDWGIDVCVTASQKGLMLPPGLAFVALSRRAIRKFSSSSLPKYYFDFKKILNSYRSEQTPWTPAISLLMGLDESLKMIHSEGLEKIWKRHKILADSLRSGIKKLGLEILSKNPSNSVTAVLLPRHIKSLEFHNHIQNKYGCIFGKGQGHYASELFRIGHIGNVQESDVQRIITAIKKTLNELK